ncbi:hypothetical protein [Bradyrhizobium sp. Tv2a-2]|uniref:hypothetical protein n=1 Tax=Bradyrhizobium sp. Tv2a-2 TaxID=113395 RepID=UPI0004258539|nr:hypothetical protein [Bradyrhizobium sp. Tv2a-2]
MTSFLSFHAAAAARGDGLLPELLALVQAAVAFHTEPVSKDEETARTDPKPASADVQAGDANVLLVTLASPR